MGSHGQMETWYIMLWSGVNGNHLAFTSAKLDDTVQ